MTPKQSFFRRCLAVLSAALLAAALVMVGTWLPAGASGTQEQMAKEATVTMRLPSKSS